MQVQLCFRTAAATNMINPAWLDTAPLQDLQVKNKYAVVDQQLMVLMHSRWQQQGLNPSSNF
jgi:hypothetical protein